MPIYGCGEFFKNHLLSGDITKICQEFPFLTFSEVGESLLLPLTSSPVSRLPSLVSHLLSPISSLPSPVSCLPSHISCLLSPVSYLSSLFYCLLSPLFITHLPSLLLSHLNTKKGGEFDCQFKIAARWGGVRLVNSRGGG